MATLPRGSTDEASIWVMIDVWYYLMGGYTRQEDPPIAELVQHWESTDDSVLRFVVVLRSLLLADETALEPLTTFLEQPTPELKELLELAMQDYDGADPMRDRTN